MGDPWGILSGLETSGALTALACAAKASGVLAGAGVMELAMKRCAAATRHVIWGLGLAGALAVLPLTFAVPRFDVAVLATEPRAETPAAQPIEKPAEILMINAAGDPLVGLPDVSPAEPVMSESPRTMWLPIVLAGGTFAVLAWSATGSVATWWLGRNTEPITDPLWEDAVREAQRRLGIARRVTLRRGGPSAMPLTWGVLRPTLLLPEGADDWPQARRRAVLLHELAHVRRRDVLTQWLGLTACAAYWFNPLAWWASARLRAECEQACDDLVLEAGERPCDYAAQLLDVARSLRPVRTLVPAPTAMARRSGLETRLVSILDMRRQRRGPGRWLVLGCLAAVLGVSATLAAVQLVAKEPPHPEIRGKVVGPDGKPIDGADVVVALSRFRSRYRDSDQPKAELLGRAYTNGQGRFRIALAREPESDDGPVTLVATMWNLGFAARSLTDLDGSIGEPLRLPVEQPVEVRLVDLEGSPVSGAEVGLSWVYSGKGGAGLSLGILSHDVLPSFTQKWTSDQHGKFLVRGLGPEHHAAFDSRAPGFGRQRLQFETKSGARTATLTLGRAHVVEGRVTLGKNGPPAVGARITSSSRSEKLGLGVPLGHDETTTDRNGRYRVEAAPGAATVLKVFPPRGAGDGYLMRGDLVNPGDSVASRVDFTMPKGVLVRGRIVEAGTGRPVAGAVV